MDGNEAIRLLKGGIEGIREFNRRRDEGEELPYLAKADLENEQLCFVEGADRVVVNLSRLNLFNANLCGANLTGANLSGANLSYANLSGASLVGANLRGALPISANLSNADLFNADLQDTNLNLANMRGANLYSAKFDGASLAHADLGDTNMRLATGLRLNSTFIRHALFDARAADPWSVLRHDYTGPALLFNLIFLCTFLGVYAARAAFWLGVNRSQQGALALAEKLAGTHPQLAEGLRALEPTLTEHSQKLAVWQVLLAMDRGPWLMILAVVLIVYNAVRWLLTRQVAAMRDAEERSGYSPEWVRNVQVVHVGTGARFDRLVTWVQAAHTAVENERRGYRWCWLLHVWIARPLFWIAVVAFLWHAWHWLTETVYLPN